MSWLVLTTPASPLSTPLQCSRCHGSSPPSAGLCTCTFLCLEHSFLSLLAPTLFLQVSAPVSPPPKAPWSPGWGSSPPPRGPSQLCLSGFIIVPGWPPPLGCGYPSYHHAPCTVSAPSRCSINTRLHESPFTHLFFYKL